MSMLSERRLRVLAAATAAVALTVISAVPAAAQEGSAARSRVLVPPLQVSSDLDDDFGKKISEEVRNRLQNFDVLSAVDEDEVNDALDRFDLDRDEMDPIQWRQLANQIDAGLLLAGQVSSSGQGNGAQVNVRFVDVSSGDAFTVEPFTVPETNDDAARQAADRIAEFLQAQVDFLRARAFCSDYLGAEQYEDALRNCNQALEINPQSVQAHMLRGRVYMDQEQWGNALEDLQFVVEQQPSNTDALQSLAYAHAQMGNMERATELYREYLTFNPKDVQVRLSVAYNLASTGATAEAIQIVQDGLGQDSTAVELWEYLGTLALRRGTEGEGARTQAGTAVADTASLELAVRAYSKVLEMKQDSLDPTLLRNTIAANRMIGNLEGALEFTEQALERYPDRAELWSQRADVLAQMERYREAIADMDSALARDPQVPNASMKKGMWALQADMEDEALAQFREAVDRQRVSGDDVANRLFSVGYQQHFQNDRYSRAIALFEQALEFAESDQVEHQIQFFTGYSQFLRGVAIDKGNTEEQCEPARRALQLFQAAQPHLNAAGTYQQQNLAQVKKNVQDYIFREEQIMKKACR